jgi:hypothetical protein
LAKNADPATDKKPKRKLLQRKLEKAQLSHHKAERNTGKLRVQLEHAEARLAKMAQHLVAVQSLMDQTGHASVAASSQGDAGPEHSGSEARPHKASAAKSKRQSSHADSVVTATAEHESDPATQNGAGAAAAASTPTT